MGTFWTVFTVLLSLPLLVFGAGETYAIVKEKPTYTNWIRTKLGLEPHTRQRVWAPVLFVLVLVGFNAWFLPHIVLGIWPRR